MSRNTFYAINTKLAAMTGKLLNTEDYKSMISLKSPAEIAGYLKNNTQYSDVLSEYDTLTMHRDDIERCLKESLINYLDKLMHYFDGEYKKFFKNFYMRYEISDLKGLARAIHINKDYTDLKNMLVFAGKYRYINIDSLLGSKSVTDIIRALDGTVYFPYVKNLLDGTEEESLYRFEMSLDRAYFSVLEENLKKMNKKDREVFYSLYGSDIDMTNLQWIYRAKKFYNLSPEEIFNYAVDKGNIFNYKKIKEFCYASNIDEFVNLARNTPYAFMFKGDENQDIFMERRMNRYMYFKLIKARKQMSNDISSVLAFLELVEFEIKDITSIIENVRYGMEYEEATKYLIKAL